MSAMMMALAMMMTRPKLPPPVPAPVVQALPAAAPEPPPPPSLAETMVALSAVCAQSANLADIAARAQRMGWAGIAAADARRLEATGGNVPTLRGWTLGEDGALYLLVQNGGGRLQCEVLFNAPDSSAEVLADLSLRGVAGQPLGPGQASGSYGGRSLTTWPAPAATGWTSVGFSPPPPSGPDAWKHSRILFQGPERP